MAHQIVMWLVALSLMFFCFCAGRASDRSDDVLPIAMGFFLGILALFAAHYA